MQHLGAGPVAYPGLCVASLKAPLLPPPKWKAAPSPPPADRRNKTPVYVSGVRYTRKFIEWIPEKTASKLLDQMKGESLLVVP
jgi:hypothetical protein